MSHENYAALSNPNSASGLAVITMQRVTLIPVDQVGKGKHILSKKDSNIKAVSLTNQPTRITCTICFFIRKEPRVITSNQPTFTSVSNTFDMISPYKKLSLQTRFKHTSNAGVHSPFRSTPLQPWRLKGTDHGVEGHQRWLQSPPLHGLEELHCLEIGRLWKEALI